MRNITRIAVYLTVYISISFSIIASQKILFFLDHVRCINFTIKQPHKHSQVASSEEAVEHHLSVFHVSCQ